MIHAKVKRSLEQKKEKKVFAKHEPQSQDHSVTCMFTLRNIKRDLLNKTVPSILETHTSNKRAVP